MARIPANAPGDEERAPLPDGSLAALFDQGYDTFRALERYVAGYTTCSNALEGLQAPAGSKRKALPLLHFAASLDGVKAIEVVLDMERPTFDKKFAKHVLVPAMNAFAADIRQHLPELQDVLTRIEEVVAPADDVGPPQQQAPAGQPARRQEAP